MVNKGLWFVVVMVLGFILVGSVFVLILAIVGKSCNYFNINLFMVQGYENFNGIWVSEGWWVVELGECVVYFDSVFIYFKISDGVVLNCKVIVEMVGSEFIKLC